MPKSLRSDKYRTKRGLPPMGYLVNDPAVHPFVKDRENSTLRHAYHRMLGEYCAPCRPSVDRVGEEVSAAYVVR